MTNDLAYVLEIDWETAEEIKCSLKEGDTDSSVASSPISEVIRDKKDLIGEVLGARIEEILYMTFGKTPLMPLLDEVVLTGEGSRYAGSRLAVSKVFKSDVCVRHQPEEPHLDGLPPSGSWAVAFGAAMMRKAAARDHLVQGLCGEGSAVFFPDYSLDLKNQLMKREKEKKFWQSMGAFARKAHS